jgi:hypothetical protein
MARRGRLDAARTVESQVGKPVVDTIQSRASQMRDSHEQLRGLNIVRSIGQLASLEYQQAFCIHGTSEQYVLLDELIEATLTRVELETTHPQLSQKWNEQVLAALKSFSATVASAYHRMPSLSSVTSLETVLQSAEMEVIRLESRKLLDAVGIQYSFDELASD